MRILLTITYDGTNFNGYQVQIEKRTVQEELERALKLVYGIEIKTVCAGRTDSGVHALSQKVHYDVDSEIDINKIPKAVNFYLPEDVRVIRAEIVSNTFNSRYSAKEKTYLYRIYTDEIEIPLKERYAVHFQYPLNYELMNEAVEVIKGEKDFKCFLASGSSVKNTVRNVSDIKIIRKDNDVEFYVTGNGFLYKMVRNIVGTLLDVGQGKKTIEEIQEAINKGDRSLVGKTMPGKGLFLFDIKYN